jgi:predicted RND superfamily exporter protein
VTRTRSFVEWAVHHGRALWIVALVLAVPAGLRTAWLYAHLRSDLEELLPKDSPSVVALTELRARLGAHKYLGVVVDAGSSAGMPAAERFLDRLAERVRSYPPGVVAAVRTGNQEEAAFLKAHGALYVDLNDLRTIRARIEARRDYEVEKAAGNLLDDSQAPPSLDFEDLRRKYESKLGAKGQRATSRYSREDLHLSVLLLELGDTSQGAKGAATTVDRVEADAEALRAGDQDVRRMRVGFAGDAAIATEEEAALVADLSVSSIAVIALVIIAIVAFYRWWRSVVVILPPLLLATIYSFGIASLPPFDVKAVNSNTAFLASIIVGNGINFALVLVARYVEERRDGVGVHESIVRAVEGSRGGTLAAAAAASASYGALAVTQFQGFRQFGFIGGIGMILAWGVSFLLTPSLITWVDTSDATRPKNVANRRRFSYWVARGVSRAPRAVVLVSLAMTVFFGLAMARFRVKDLETDFSQLRRRDTWTSGEGYWGQRMDSVLGEYLTPLVFLGDDKPEMDRLAALVRAHLGEPPFVGRLDSVRTIDDVLPAEQDAKRAVLEVIKRDLTPNVRKGLSKEASDLVLPLLEESAMQPLTLKDLPPTFTVGLRERDGTVGHVILVSPTPSGAWWDADAIGTLVTTLRDEARLASARGDARAPRLAGSIPVSSDIVQAIRRDGPLASLAALASVAVVVTLMLRTPMMIAYVLGALVVGVLWMGVRLNFANFIAFPITFGIGVDYAVNVMSRYVRDGKRDILHAVRSTGAAVALCSLTTIIGYSSLLMAQNRALYLFGFLAVLGELSCLTVALVSLPSLVLWLRGSEEASTQEAATALESSAPR